jgi:hypothetical protein
MANETEERDEHWGEHMARLTFIFTVVCAALFFAVVLAFILAGGPGR